MIPKQIGRYEIKEELGRGGMAMVYRASDPEFGREVAVKVLPPEMLHDPSFRARFKREAKIIASLEHPAIVPVYDFGEDNGQPYLVMRYMTGGSLALRLQQGPMALPEVARIVSALAAALDEAHNKGIIHRDLKPANILFDQHRLPYIADFGIAKMAEGTASFTGSAVVGTPAYMSPEQVRGEHDIDGRSDLYSFGLIVFEMLTAQQPFKADTPVAMAMKHIGEPPPRLRIAGKQCFTDKNTPSRLIAVCRRQSSSDMCTIDGTEIPMPALETRISSRPKRCSMSATTSIQRASLVTS